jgi:AcrR family transcriptional regulator
MEKAYDRILASAVHLFGKHGFGKVSVRQIAQMARVNPSAINYHFGGKEGLYRRIIHKYGSERSEWALESLGRESDPLHSVDEFTTRMSTLAHYLVKVITQDVDFHNILVREQMEGLPYAKEEFGHMVPYMINKIAAFIGKGQEAGIVQKKLNPNMVAMIFLMTINTPFERKIPLKEHRIVDLDPTENIEEYIETVLNIFFSGVLIHYTENGEVDD